MICFLSVCTSAPSASVARQHQQPHSTCTQLSIPIALLCSPSPFQNRQGENLQDQLPSSDCPRHALLAYTRSPSLPSCYIVTLTHTNDPMQTTHTPSCTATLTDMPQNSSAPQAGRESPPEQRSMAFIFSMLNLTLHFIQLTVLTCMRVVASSDP